MQMRSGWRTLLVVASAGAVLVLALALAGVQMLAGGRAGAAPRSAIPSPTPLVLTAAQRTCVDEFFGPVVFNHFNRLQQEGTLQTLQDCVDRILGTPLPPPKAYVPVPISSAERALYTPVPTRLAGDGVIGESGANALTHAGQQEFYNVWSESVSWGSINVWAGYLAPGGARDHGTAQGLISIAYVPASGLAPPAGIPPSEEADYPTPSRHGGMRVVGAVGDVLELKSVWDGTTYYFDVGARTYVSGFPSVTPTPAAGAATPASGAATAHPRASATATATATAGP